MTLAVIVQARMGSSRCPGKVMKDLAGQPFLKHCLDRCARIPGADMVVVAVPGLSQDDPVAEAAKSWGYQVVRGSEKDVLSRYAKAAREVIATAVMRVTSDCPVIDPEICGETIRFWKENGADYGSNRMPPGFPHGLDCEVFHASLLHAANALATDPYEREHVTPWIRHHPDLKTCSLRGAGGGIETLRWTLDYAEDIEMFRALFAAAGPQAYKAGAAELMSLCLRRPDIPAINGMRVDLNRLANALEAEITSPPLAIKGAA